MIFDDATRAQIDAADPRASTWLSANAGSGKTRVLTDRVARLLFNGVRPEHILCLTYTKAAAAEMQNRLFRRLGEWAMMPDGDLANALAELGEDGPFDSGRLARARRLFAAALETPGGLRIQTIHAFCAGLLRRFPLEAGLTPQFREMEDHAADLLRRDVLDAMSDGPDAVLVDGLARVFTGEETDKLLSEIASRAEAFRNPPDTDRIAEILQVPADLSLEDVLSRTFLGNETEMMSALHAACAAGSSNDVKAAAKLAQLDGVSRFGPHELAVLEDVFLNGATAKAGPFSAKIDAFPTKSTRESHPDLIAQLNPLMARVEDARRARIAIAARDATLALHAFAHRFVTLYGAAKQDRGLLDFGDLISRARALLSDPAVAQWVLYRLDGGVEHILVDEAQDTAPDQWEIVRLLTGEFAVGEGAQPDVRRTVFVVGDKKQSIYSFQGADPDGFDRMRDYFSGKLAEIDDRLEVRRLVHSFRSSDAVLNLVDQTFVAKKREGLEEELEHTAFKTDLPGRVDLWPVIEPVASREKLDWDDPTDMKGETHHHVLLAERIAGEIRRMLDEATLPVHEDGALVGRRTVRPGDIMVLVRRRSGVFPQIIAACKKAGLDIAGADKMRLGGELAVRDIAALLSFVALPEDDLSLAAALRSPLLGWSEQQLFTLAHGRGKRHLWQVLRERDDVPETLEILHDLRRNADFLRPYDLINRILTRHRGRERLIGRLGEEAEDGIDALLYQALAFEQNEVPGLTGFLSWLETEEVEIKRQVDNAGDRIRVMTVHGAKGLEAPIVILPDTAEWELRPRDQVLELDGLPIWRPKSEETPEPLAPAIEDWKEKQRQERRRLLYVAMTRAETWLIVCAAGRLGKDPDGWYRTIEAGMIRAGAERHAFPFGDGLRLSHQDWQAGPSVEPRCDGRTVSDLPELSPNLPDMPERKETLAPSDLGGAKVLPGDPAGEDREAALARGRLVHLLLEHLPSLPRDRREDFGRALIASVPETLLLPDATELVAEVRTLIDTPALADIFAPDALTEVDVTATLEALGARRVHGAIDRLIVTPDRVLAIDFKTNRIVPDDPIRTPSGLLAQMAAYRDALRQVYPDRIVETAILWTATATLMPLPDDLLDPALAEIAAA